MGISDRFDRVAEMVDKIIEREEQYQMFLDASPWGILVVDQTFHIVFVNKTFERMSGYRFSELSGKHLHTLMPSDDAVKHVVHEKSYVKNPRNRMGNHGLKPKILTKSGAVVPVEISLSPTTIHGNKLFFASIRPLETLFNTVEGSEIAL